MQADGIAESLRPRIKPEDKPVGARPDPPYCRIRECAPRGVRRRHPRIDRGGGAKIRRVVVDVKAVIYSEPTGFEKGQELKFGGLAFGAAPCLRSEEHTSELQSLMRMSYAVFWWKKILHT